MSKIHEICNARKKDEDSIYNNSPTMDHISSQIEGQCTTKRLLPHIGEITNLHKIIALTTGFKKNLNTMLYH
jgi:hypothetical protein